MIIVTPFIVRPVDADQLRTPLDPYRVPPTAKTKTGPTRRTVPVDPAQASSLGDAPNNNTGFILD